MIEYLTALKLLNTIASGVPWVLGVLIIPYVIHLRGIRSDRKIAKESGAFKRAELFAGVHGYRVINGATLNMVVGKPFSPEVLAMHELIVSVGNTGERDLEAVVVRFRYAPKSSNFMNIAGTELKHSLPDDEIVRKEVSSKNEQTHVTRIQRVTPRTMVEVPERIRLSESLHEIKDLDVVTKDGVQAFITFNLTLASTVDISIAASNEPPFTFELKMFVYRATSIDQLVSDFKDYLKDKRRRDGRTANEAEQYLFVMPKYTEHKLKKGKVVAEGFAKLEDTKVLLLVEHGSDVLVVDEARMQVMG